MYEKLSILSSDELSKLTTLKSQISFSSKYRRMGSNGIEGLSVYNQSKWTDWNRTRKAEFKSCFADDVIENSVVGWFLNFPANTGFLDLMTAWNGVDSCGTIVAYPLEAQDIWLNGTQISLAAGEGIKFKLNVEHEIKTSTQERNWACVMMMV